MIPPPPPLPTLVKTRTSQSRVPPIPQRAAIPFNYGPTPPVQETGYEPDQNSQAEEATFSPLAEENEPQSPPPSDSQGDDPPDVEKKPPPVQETSPAAQALSSLQNETTVEEDHTQEHEDVQLP
ncbi:vegetative cell wall protein gp1 [Oryzias latipes]|uniref:vegetative cell wall protein gp1 n=1 Tax=Oryzias latipes TaxID=8090 RepID=UPI0002A4C1E5|nr:vegetative cell wall protein gp1 [Oryzias latipes]